MAVVTIFTNEHIDLLNNFGQKHFRVAFTNLCQCSNTFNGSVTNFHLLAASSDSILSVLRSFPNIKNLFLYFMNHIDGSLFSGLFDHLDSITIFVDCKYLDQIINDLSPLMNSKIVKKVIPIVWYKLDLTWENNFEEMTWRNRWKLLPPMRLKDLLYFIDQAMNY